VRTSTPYATASPDAGIAFGDITGVATSISHWSSFKHSALVPEPASITLLALGAVTLLRRRRQGN
jgi:hypothetical protein